MKKNLWIQLLCSIPVILVLLYFFPFLGIGLIVFRHYTYHFKKYDYTPIILIGCGLLICVPQIIHVIINDLKVNSINMTYVNTIVNSEFYLSLLHYSKRLMIIGILFLILFSIFQILSNKMINFMKIKIEDYIQEDLRNEAKIKKINDLKMQEKREKAKNTSYVHCPYCGSDNILSEKTGKCKFCRRTIENKNYQS